MKLCKDCKHVSKGFFFFDSSLWKCRYSLLNAKASPVDGQLAPTFSQYCNTKRDSMLDPCGPEGNLWESPND